MAYRSLRSFLERLERAGELVRVAEAVDPVLEMAALADRAAKQQGPALLFEKPRGASSELRELLHLAPPVSFWEKLKLLPRLGRLAAYMPKHVADGPVREIVEDEPDLGLLPVLTTW